MSSPQDDNWKYTRAIDLAQSAENLGHAANAAQVYATLALVDVVRELVDVIKAQPTDKVTPESVAQALQELSREGRI